MTTKFRSACDRCHNAKVRCSGSMPCQGCIASKTLCFYSVSNVLGRPRGTKNKTSRRKNSANAANPDSPTPERAQLKAPVDGLSNRRRKNTENRSDPEMIGIAISENDESDIPSLVNSGIPTPTENMWFLPENGHGVFGIPGMHASPDMRIDPYTPITGHTPPPSHLQFDPSLDLAMSDFSAPEDLETRFLWDGGMYQQDQLETTEEFCPTLPTPRSDDGMRHMTTASGCTCLQQHAELLSNPSIAEMNGCTDADDTMLSLDKALSLAREGINVWRCLIECQSCDQNNDQEVMLLALASIRSVTRYLQRLSPRYMPFSQSESKPFEDESQQRHQREEQSRLMLGSLEVDEEERILVYRLLFQKTVQKVRQALHSLQMIQHKRKKQLLMETSNRTAAAEDYHASSSLSHLQQMTHTLSTTLQSLESAYSGVR